jgi:hypothetical protein
MNPEDALRALADADRDRQAPPEIEARLLVAFGKKRRGPVWPIAIAAALIIMLGAVYFRPHRIEPVQVTAAPAPSVERQRPAPENVRPVAQSVATPLRARRNRRPREVATEFFPLVEMSPPLDRAELLRVSLPASAMRAVGLPVREDRLSERVQADVLVSEGLATAIRFVKFQ